MKRKLIQPIGLFAYLITTMPEENLQHLSPDDLYALMVRTIEAYLILHKDSASNNELTIKRSELAVIQKVIAKRKAGRAIENFGSRGEN